MAGAMRESDRDRQGVLGAGEWQQPDPSVPGGASLKMASGGEPQEAIQGTEIAGAS